jgi:hypothetical protein
MGHGFKAGVEPGSGTVARFARVVRSARVREDERVLELDYRASSKPQSVQGFAARR